MVKRKTLKITEKTYNILVQAALKNNSPHAVKFISDFIRDFGFETDDLKLVWRIKPEITSSKEKCEEFLNQKVQEVIRELFPVL